MPYSNSEIVEDRPKSKTNDGDLTDRQLLLWGAAGGALSVAASYGLLEGDKITNMLQGAQPYIQVITAAIIAGATIAAGAVWAKVHKPLRSQMTALQLGVIAPAAINALVASPVGDRVDRVVAYGLRDVHLISRAYAQPATQTRPQPSTVECIVKAVIKRPC